MPVVIPAGASSSSSAQTVATSAVYDYLQNDAGVAIAGVTVIAVLNGDFTTTISPQVLLAPIQLSATTDANGFWQLSLIPNTNISPANTTYTIQTPFRSYDIQVGPSGPYQSTSLGTLVNIPVTLGPATSSITGALSVSGAFTATAGATINGGLTVTGALSLPGAALSLTGPLTLTAAASTIVPGVTSLSLRNNANTLDNLLITDAGNATVRGNLAVTGAGTVTGMLTASNGMTVTSGGLTIGAFSGPLIMQSVVSQIIPGVTSFAIRNNANALDNVLVSDAGAVTIRSGLTITASGETITAGNLTLTAGNLVFSAASASIIPGATNLLLRNNANSASNLAITDAGLATFRNAVSVPPSAGAALPTTSYGTLMNLLDSQAGTAVASVTVTIPATRSVWLEIEARSDQAAGTGIQMQFNADVGANYDGNGLQDTNATLSGLAAVVAGTSARVGVNTPSGATAGAVGVSSIKILNADSTTQRKNWTYASSEWATDAAGSALYEAGQGQWRNTANAITSIKIFPSVGNFANVRVRAYGLP